MLLSERAAVNNSTAVPHSCFDKTRAVVPVDLLYFLRLSSKNTSRAGGGDRTFRLRLECDWEPDWEEFERAVVLGTRMVYVSNPNNPTGSVLSESSMKRIVERCETVGAYVIVDEVYLRVDRLPPDFDYAATPPAKRRPPL